MQRTQITIDLDVYKEIQKRLELFDETPNQVLRRVFGLPPIGKEEPPVDRTGLFTKGVHLRDGLNLRKKYKGQMLEAEVKDGSIVFNGKSFNSPSAAAIEATGTVVNGWRFWEFFDEISGSWKPLSVLRRGQEVRDGNW
jgi:hypothetical protein